MLQHQAVAPRSPDRNAAEIPKALAVPATIPKVAVKAPAAPDLAVVTKHYAATGAPAAPAEKAEPRRVSARTNKRHAPRRYSPSALSNVTITTVLLSLFFILLLATAAGAQDIIVLPKLGAIAEKILEVAVDFGSAQFSMVLRLVIHDTVHNTGHPCLTNDFARNRFKKKTNYLVPTWIDESSVSTNTLSKRREKRSQF